jgi:hypothetical protein
MLAIPGEDQRAVDVGELARPAWSAPGLAWRATVRYIFRKETNRCVWPQLEQRHVADFELVTSVPSDDHCHFGYW